LIRKTLKFTKAATFSIDIPDFNRNGPPAPAGTGFFISPDGWFVTAAHVVMENNSVRKDISQAWLMAEPSPGSWGMRMCQSVSLDYIEPSVDFALLRVDFSANETKDWLKHSTSFPYIEISTRELSEGEPVYAFGYPLPWATALSKGPIQIGLTSYCPRTTSAIVASLVEQLGPVSSSGDPQTYVLDKALNYGNSGGPVVSSETGKVHAFCSRFQPVEIPQPRTAPSGQQVRITIPSLYGIVTRLSNQSILTKLREKNIPISYT
jgi:serine protease Do